MLACVRSIVFAAAIGATVATPALAADGWVRSGNSSARLNLCDSQPRVAGVKQEVLAFLELQLDPGWKTYWRFPGDSGVSPSFELAPSSNVTSLKVEYPAPHRLSDQGGEAIGYNDAVTFPIRLVPKDPNAPIAPTLTFSYGICKNICVPAEVQLTAACHGVSPAVAASVDAVPRSPMLRRPSDPKLIGVSGSVVGTPPRLIIDVDFGVAAQGTDLFVEAPAGLYVPLPARATPDATGRARFTLDLSKVVDAKDLIGQQLKLTMVSDHGASETVWLSK